MPASGSSPASSGTPAASPAPGLREAFGRTRAAVTRLVSAHVELLKTELSDAAHEVGIIAGLAGAAFVLVILMLILVYVGTLLFLGEWLFGSIGWGVLDGVLLTTAFIVPIGLNLAGGSVSAWVRALVIAFVLGVAMAVIFAFNACRNSAVWLSDQLHASVALEPGLLAWLSAAVVGAIVVGVLLLLVALRRRSGAIGLTALGLIVGFLLGALLGYITFDLRGALAISVTVGLILWLALTGWLALRRGFDPQKRYAKLIPRESMAQLTATRAYLEQQWQRQRKKLARK